MTTKKKPAATAAQDSAERSGGANHWPTIVAVLALLATLWIYRAQREDAAEFMRRSTTVDLVSMRYTDRILSAEKNLNDYILKNYELYARAEFAASEEEKSVVELPANVRSDFMLMVDFYSDILICRESTQCQPALLDQWFKEDICQFMSLGNMIGFPQLREQYGDGTFERLDAFKASDCKKAG